MACVQSDKALFGRLCPAGRDGRRAFAPVMLRRLRKLGIPKTDPDELTFEEQSRCGPWCRAVRLGLLACAGNPETDSSESMPKEQSMVIGADMGFYCAAL